MHVKEFLCTLQESLTTKTVANTRLLNISSISLVLHKKVKGKNYTKYRVEKCPKFA